MNKIFRLIWSDTLGSLVAVAEIVSSRGRGAGKRRRLLLPAMALVLSVWIFAGTAGAGTLPTGGDIVAGSGSIATNGNTLTVTQDTQRMAADWTSFSIGQNNTVNFSQPSSSAVALNRVTGGDASVIQGALNANGQVFLVNPNGVLFSSGAQVNVGGLVASTLDIGNDDFMAGNYRFAGNSSNAIVNQGNITAHNGGTIALIAARIDNSGTLTANGGNVLMGAGRKVALDLGGPVKIEVEEAAIDALIEQGGAIRADGGLVYLTARAAGELTSTVINHTGITQARALATGENGEIYLMGDMDNGRIEVAGTLDASAPHGGDGGFIETSAAEVQIKDGLEVTTAAPLGKTGEWLIDPNDYTIAASGGDITGEQLSTNLGTTNITIQSIEGVNTSGNGDIFVNDSITWDSNILTLNAQRNIEINRELFGSGTAGLALEYGQGAVAAGNTAEYYVNAPVNLASTGSFSTKLGSDGAPLTYTIITELGAQGSTTGTDLQGINGNLSGRYVLGADIDASATADWNSGAGFRPIALIHTENFTGTFDGLGHEITSLTIDRPDTSFVGLFGRVRPGGTVKNVGMTGVSITGANYVGGLIASATEGSVTNSYATGVVTGNSYVGGLIASATEGSVTNSYATGVVTGNSYVGGLIGYAREGNATNSYATGVVTGNSYVGGLIGYASQGSVTNSYATGVVTGTSFYAGGLIGRVYQGSVTNSYATGEVDGHWYSGGLIGNLNQGSVTNSYATGAVTGRNDYVGGLIGTIDADPTIANSYWDTQTSGMNTSAGGEGRTTAEMQRLLTFEAWMGEDSPWTFSAGTAAEGYEAGLPYLSNVTREEDRPQFRILFGGGWGDNETPYSITDWNQLQDINVVVGDNFSFKLVENLDTSTAGYALQVKVSETLANGGKGWEPIGTNSRRFIGHFDGNGYTIRNLMINRPTENYVGLFGATENANLLNLAFHDFDVTGNRRVGGLIASAENTTINRVFSSGVVSSTGTDHSIVGGLAGETLGATSIENTWFGGDVTAISRNVGGLVGLMAGSSSIQNSYVTANVRIVEQSNHGAIGGLVGSVDATATGKIENSYATGSVIATNTNTSNIMNVGVGGLVGQIRGSESGFSIVNSYAVGTVGSYSGSTTNAGGLVGVNNTTNAVINSFWDIHKSGITTSAGGEGKTTTEMHTLSTFSDWTVDGSPWTFTAGGSSVEGYEVVLPYLTDVTREEDRELSVLFAGGWGGLTSGDSDGTPYTITDWNQLQNINAVVGGNFSFQLSNSLDAETTGYAQKVKDGEVLANNGAGWKPIGSVGLSDSPFVGIFDGGGHTISNLTINRPQDDYIGLFGATQNAAISNLILSDVDIRGDALVGSVVGEARNTHLENIAVTSGMVTGFLNVGGLAGWFEEATISKSYAMGDVTGEARVGGLAGNLANGEISESYATGNVTGNELVGGLIGTAINASTVEQSYYSTGTVAGNFSVGGLVGEAVSTTITDSYAHGSIISADKGGQEFPDEAIGGLVGKLLESSVSNSYAVGQISPSGDAQDVGGLIGHAVDSDVIDSFWDAQLSGVYTSAGGEGKTTTEMHALSTFSAWNGEGSPWTLTAGASAVAGYEVVLPYLAHVTRDEDRELSVLFAGGWGNGETPYAITNWNQLQNINAVVGEDFSFKLSNNLDVSITGYAQQVGEEDTLANDGKGWMPIGANATRFTGTFDGGGHTINNLIINMAEADDVGLFGVSDNASLRNLTLYNAEVTGKDYVGGLVGRATDTSIENIHIVGGRVGALRYVGGVVGQILTVGDGVSAINTSSSSASVISTGSGEFSDAGGLAGNLRGNTTLGNSWASGDVTAGFRNVGGLVGFLYGAAVIENSYATGDVKMVEQSSHGAIGGLVGSVATDATGKIKNSYATGNVIAPNSSSSGVNQGVGGLVGQIRDSGTGFSIINSYAIGTVGSYSGSTTNVGGLVGVNKANPTIANSFWDTQTSGITTSAGGEGKTTTQMHTLSTFSNWNVDGSPWTLTAGGSAVEGYEVVLPYLTNVTREEDRVLSVLFDGGWGGLTNGDADGTPYTITDWDQLQNINAVVDQGFDFVLQNDLDADTVGYTQQVKENELLANDGKGWAPIGSWSNPAAYTGTFDGNNKTISGLIINRPNEEDVGLFGTAVDATIGNLTLSDVDILGGDAVGSVVGMAGNTHLENITVTGGAVAGTYDVGGLVGVMTESLRTIVDSHANVSVSGNAVVGGLVGSLYGSSIINSSASGSVNGTSGGPRGLGGLVGGASSGAQIIGSHATGDVESGAGEEADSRNFGGLVGLADDNVHIENSYATGNVVGGRYVGGLVGWMGASLKTIQRSYATGDVMGTEGVGGLVGFLDSSTISESYATGDVTGIISVGGLAGLLVDSVVNESYAAGNVTGNLLVGGLAGEVGSSTVEQSFYSPGTVAGNFYVGGLVGGAVGSTIDNSYAQATIIEADREGMLIPDEVGFDADFAIGGLVGILLDSTVSNSYAAGQISHADDAQDVGGLIGLNAVFGEDYQFVPRPTNDNITNSFWDTQVSGLTTSAGGEGKTTAEMQILSTFNQAGWNIERDADLDNIFPFLSFTDDGNGGYTATWVVGKYLLNFALSDVGADGSIIYDGQAWLLGDYWAISEDIFGAAGAGFELGDDFIFVRNNESVSGFTNAGSYEGISVTLLNEDYRIASPGNTQGSFRITPRPISVTADEKTKVYGNADPALTYTINSGSLVGNDSLGALIRAPGENVGSYLIDASVLENGNYLITANNGALSITQRPITVTADDQSKVYGNADPALTYTINSGNLVGNDSLGALMRAEGENVGSYVIDASVLENGNYLITANNGALSITQRPISVTADDQSKVYGNDDPALTYTINSGSLVGSDSLGALTRAEGENVGSYLIDASVLENGNYLITANNGALSITPRPITIVADDKSKVYGQDDPELSWQVTEGNLVDEDTLSGTLSRVEGEDVGSYLIDASALANGNYLITANDGTLTITPATNEKQQAAQTVAQNLVTQMVSDITGGTATPSGSSIALSTPQQTSASGGSVTSSGFSGGLKFVDADPDVAAEGAGGDAVTSGPRPGRDSSGFMNVFVVSGGVNYSTDGTVGRDRSRETH